MAFRPIAFCTASVLALSLAGIANAQETGTSAADSSDSENQEIIVTGVRASIVGALNVRKESVQIVDSIVAEDVGKLPDNNVVEALQRVTGIQVTDRGGGEAATVTIRGLADPLTTLNGRNIFTAAGQSFALQDISANLVKQVDVFKTRSADQIETGLAGQIDVKTRMPFDFDGFTVSGLARGIYNEQADSYNPNVALLVSDRWETGIGDIGLLVNGSYSRTKYRNMTVTAGAMVPFLTDGTLPTVSPTNNCPTPPADWVSLERVFPTDCRAVTATNPLGKIWTPGQDYGLSTAPGSTLSINGQDVPYYLSRDAAFASDAYGKRERPSVNVALQWAPNSSSVYTAEMFYAGFRGNNFNSLQFSFVDWWGNPGAFELYDGTNIIKSRTVGDVYGFNSGDYSTSKTDSFVYALNGKWDVADGHGKIIADAAYQTSTNKTSFQAMRTDRVADQITVDFNPGNGVTSYHFDDDALLADPSVWNVAEFFDNADKNKGSALTLTLDGYYDWDEGFLRRIKAGLRYDDRKAKSYTRSRSSGRLGVSLDSLPEEALFTNSGFMDGVADVPRSWVLPDGGWLHNNADYVRGLYGLSTSDSLSLFNTFDIDEATMSAYVMADAEVSVFGRPLQLEGGVRYVSVTTNSNFFNRFKNGELTRGGSQSEKFLPSFTARYEITPNLRLRFNYGETLRRPSFGDINPNYSLTGDLTRVGYGSGTAGTADLKPTHSKNFDLALEWYFEPNSAIYVTGFRREIEGLVVPLSGMEIIPNNGIAVGTPDYTERFVITRPANASNGVLKGVEVGLTYFPTYLPGLLDGLGVQGSLTVLDSDQTIPVTDDAGNFTGVTHSQFFNVSKLSYNATLAYDHGPINARLSYVWRKGFLHNNEARLFANPIGIWFRPEESLDAQLTWNITDQVGLTFDATNLTKSKQQSYYKFDNVGNPQQFNFGTLLLARTFAAGVRFTF